MYVNITQGNTSMTKLHVMFVTNSNILYTTLLYNVVYTLHCNILIDLFNLPVNAFPRCSSGDKLLSCWYTEPKQNESQSKMPYILY